jgi:uncharacterized protein (TIGR02147 family)
LEPIDYRDELLSIYHSRVQRNPSYTLASFARNLKLSVGTVSMILSKKRGLSHVSAQRVVHLLGLSEVQKNDFLQSVQYYSSRLKNIKAKNIPLSSEKNVPLSSIPFELKWQHLVLREMVSLPDFEPSAKWISEKLNMTPEQALIIWQECLGSNLILQSENGRFHAVEQLVFGNQGPSETIKNLHRDFLGKTIETIDKPISERNFSSVLMTISERQYEEITRLVSNFNTEMSKVIKSTDLDCKDRVAYVGTQIFTL